ncbi:MAG TPA: orotidine-5'-phosphate decarboxylase [Conexibacter sp.]|jgi:orotidine-5'-phosphate decarboxylase|nr:orotidine-5'-phosphate decarboxylase [Conexibacter sp.]
MSPACHFADRLIDRVDATRSHLVVGLDPDLRELPSELLDGVTDLAAGAVAVEAFSTAVIDGVADLVPAVKPQSAFFEALGSAGVAALERVEAHARAAGLLVIEDAKRGDIGTTMAAYAAAALGRVRIGEDHELPVHDADAVTVSPYLGPESLAPMIAVARRFGKGLFVLVRTSNPASGELQDAPIGAPDGPPLHERVAAMVDALGEEGVGERGYSDVGAVTGLTYPEQAPALRALMPRSYLLVPGLGAQGGKPEDFALFLDDEGLGAVAAASRSIAGGWRRRTSGEPMFTAIREGAGQAARDTNAALTQALAAADRWRW